MKLYTLILLLVLAAALTVGTISLVFSLHTQPPKNSRTLPYLFMVNETAGVDVGTDMLRLGQLRPGDSSWRNVSISDVISEAVVSNQTVTRVQVYAVGPGSEWITITPGVVELPGEIQVKVNAPDDAKYGTYRGEIVVVPLSTG